VYGDPIPAIRHESPLYDPQGSKLRS
jgi:hypothetical protein